MRLDLPALALVFASCSSEIETTGRFRAEVWADNWFALSVGETQVMEDSVSITTEKSFNSETFGFDGTYPLVLNFTIKDYKADDSGLEYLGTDRQQMGDGGFIAQIRDTTTGALIAVSSSAWHCLVTHRAPLDTACASGPSTACTSLITPEPEGWKAATFDASGWPQALEYSADAVGAKDGYDEITWDATARLIWAASLKQDNTLLCKVIVQEPK